MDDKIITHYKTIDCDFGLGINKNNFYLYWKKNVSFLSL